jgi:hypothetical protein
MRMHSVDYVLEAAIIVEEFRDVNTLLLTRTEFETRETVIAKDSFMSRLLLTGTHDMGLRQWEEEILPQYVSNFAKFLNSVGCT